jgi:NTE family protein
MIHYRNELVRAGIKLEGESNKEIFVHSISAYNALGHLSYSSKMNTSWEFLLKLKALGREYADNWIENDYELVGVRSSFDIEKHFLNRF